MDDVIPGILHWTAKHPNLGVDVSSYLLTDSGTALDPLLPGPDGIERAVLTVRHHKRSTPELGVPVFVHRSGLHEFEGDGLDLHPYEAGDELVPGVRVLPFGRICPDDAVLHIAMGDGVLAFGDGIINYGGIGFVPDQYIGDDPAAIQADIVDGLVPLLDEDFDTLLFAHGEPIAAGAKQMLREFVDARR